MTRSSAPGTGASPSKRKSTSNQGKSRKPKREERGAFVNHQSAVDFLDSRINVERVRPDKVDSEVWKLDRMRALLSQLGDPHIGLEIVHIAGSKGKGSVCNTLECTLEACGYTTGVFTSPHLIDVRERIRIGTEPITEELFDQALEMCRDGAIAIEGEHGSATYFELITALSFVVFAQQAVDLVVLETGIGGRLDCTNVVSPRVCGLTSIHLEHTQILGDTLESIAAEKAGIMKPGAVTISAPQLDEVICIFKEKALASDTTLKLLGEDVAYSRRFQSGVGRGPHARVCVGEDSDGLEHMSVPLLGMHQADNCGLALAILLELRQHGFELPERMISAGLEQINRQGRLELVYEKPRILIDGAHTPESIRETLKAVGAHFDYDSLIVIFGCAADKDVDLMLTELDRGADKVLFTKASANPRAIEPDELLSRFSSDVEGHAMAESKPCVKDAMNDAARAVAGNDLILIMGSFYIAGEAKSLIQARKAKR
jgi:dihydrofolate synthase/folylpolyglutamate synthase